MPVGDVVEGDAGAAAGVGGDGELGVAVTGDGAGGEERAAGEPAEDGGVPHQGGPVAAVIDLDGGGGSGGGGDGEVLDAVAVEVGDGRAEVAGIAGERVEGRADEVQVAVGPLLEDGDVPAAARDGDAVRRGRLRGN